MLFSVFLFIGGNICTGNYSLYIFKQHYCQQKGSSNLKPLYPAMHEICSTEFIPIVFILSKEYL
jgi:hypothetical protein